MNEENLKTEEGDFKLIPLDSDQHKITRVPKTTTDFPFFYLTKHKDRLSQPVVYEGVDGDGRPIRWTATPNSIIGSPGIDAHEVWTRLVKPTWESYRSSGNQLPNILPLGGVRKCLRVVGWGEGGWEARRLLKALNQIGATWCNADFWLPTNKVVDDKPTFRLIKGSFSRLTIFAIGEKHLTEEELQTGQFDFNFSLEDTLYIQFHPLEVAIQESQPQRYLDNEYMFSVGAAGRRWYELMAGKIFGVVKNNGNHCEILYSQYVKHHHTLRRQTTRRRVVQQINTILRAHIESKFLDRVEYRPIREVGKQLDFLILFFPGHAAKESVSRVASVISGKRKPPTGEPRRRRYRDLKSTTAETVDQPKTQDLNESSSDGTATMSAGSEGVEVKPELIEALTSRGIFRSQAIKLLAKISPDKLDTVPDYIDYWDSIRKTKLVGEGLLYELIRDLDPLPSTFETTRRRQERLASDLHRKEITRIEESQRTKYEEFKQQAAERFIASFPVAELERRIVECKAGILAQPGFWSNRPEVAEQLARHTVRAQIVESANVLSYEEFCRVAPAEATDAGSPIGEVESLVSTEPNTVPNAVYTPPTTDPLEDEVFVVTDENSSPQAI